MGFTIMHKSYTYHRKCRLIFKCMKSTFFSTMSTWFLDGFQTFKNRYPCIIKTHFVFENFWHLFLFLTHKNTNDLLDHSKIPIDVRKVMCFTVKGLPPIKAVK